jgi:hypothetical protein
MTPTDNPKNEELIKMSETHTEQQIDDCQPAVTEIDSPRKALMEALGIKSVNTLKTWCGLWGISYKAEFTPDEVAKLRHTQHHLQVKKLSTAQYKELISGRTNDPSVNDKHGRYTSTNEQASGHSSDVKAAIQQRYGQTINSLSKPLADAFWQQLDIAVMKELVISATKQEVPLIEAMLMESLTGEEQQTLFFLTSEDCQTQLLSASYEE